MMCVHTTDVNKDGRNVATSSHCGVIDVKPKYTGYKHFVLTM